MEKRRRENLLRSLQSYVNIIKRNEIYTRQVGV